MKYITDSFVAHQELTSVLNSRDSDGWTLLRIIECAPINDRDSVTLIWMKD